MSINKRLIELEAAAEADVLRRWKTFWQPFTDAEVRAIANGEADTELLDRVRGCEKLVIPREYKRITRSA